MKTGMKNIIFICSIFVSFNTFADDLKTTVQEQMKFFQTNSYSCIFAVPDPLNSNAVVNALVPMHEKHLNCTDDYVSNEASVSTGDRTATGDTVLFSATMCRTGLTQFCDNIKNSLHADASNVKEDGRPYRSPILKPTKNYSGDSDNTFSMDHTLGVLLYLETTFNNIQNNTQISIEEKKYQIKNLQDYAKKFAQYIYNNHSSIDYKVCPTRLDNITVCSTSVFPGIVQLVQDVYTYIGITDAPFPNKIDVPDGTLIYLLEELLHIQLPKFECIGKSGTICDVDTIFDIEKIGCLAKAGYLCNLASVVYLIEKDMNFSTTRTSDLRSRMEDSRKLMVTLSSNNPWQTYALSLADVAPIDWQSLGQETVDICKNTMDNPDWINADNRSNWLWEQSNSDIKTGPNNKNVWGWDCLGMLNLVNLHI